MAQERQRELDAVKEEAAAWVVRLSRENADETDRAAFEAWRAGSPAHEVAYEREAAAWDRLDRLRALRPASSVLDPDLLARPPRGSSASRRASRALRWAAAASLAAAAGGGAVMVWMEFSAPAYATAVGERRTVVLEDGTNVELNTDSRIIVHYRKGTREVELERGEALFEIAREARPFVVVARRTKLKVDSSFLDVRLRGDQTAIVVKDGTVGVQSGRAAAGAGEEARLAAGMEGVYGAASGSAHAVSNEEIDRVLAWRAGAIDLYGQSLRDAVAEFNRYNKRQIVVTDDAIADLRLGGYFQTHDVEGFVRALGTTFRIKVSTGPDGSIFLSRAG